MPCSRVNFTFTFTFYEFSVTYALQAVLKKFMLFMKDSSYLIFDWPCIISIYNRENNQLDATIGSLLKFQS